MEVLSENKIFSNKGSTYRLRKIDLGVLNKAVPLLLKFRRLLFEYTKDIDDSELHKARNEIEEIKTAISQVESLVPADTDESARLKGKLDKAESELKNNGKLQSQLQYISEAETLALFELLTDRNTILPLLKNILEPIDNTNAEIDIEDSGSLEFIKEVVTDFFSLTLGSKGK
jgi:predicted RNase H-like nuclease (RuvC/YqgF family)